MFEIAVNTWAFREDKLEEFIPKLAGMGFEYIDISAVPKICPHVLPEFSSHKLIRIKEMCESSGIAICALHTGNNFTFSDPNKWEKEVDWIRRFIDICKTMDVNLLIIHEGELSAGDNKEEAYNRVGRAFGICADYASKFDIKLAWENHAVFSTNAKTMHKMVKRVDHPNFGINYDSGNFAIMGEDPVNAVEELSKHIFHVHLKDIVKVEDKYEYTGIGEGIIDFDKIIKILRDNQYPGYITVEYEGNKSAEKGTKDSLLNLKEILRGKSI